MLLKRTTGWEIPEARVTPERLFLNRRHIIGAAAGVATLIAGGRVRAADDPAAALYPAVPNPAYKDGGRALTAEHDATTYNNYYEFGESKRIAKASEALKIRPWTVAIDGEVEKPLTFDIDTLMKTMGLEERVYRHRCVEAWSMVVPWTGFPLRKLVDLAKPTSKAKFVRFESFNRPDEAPGQDPNSFSPYPWPYVENLTMAEAANDLAFMVTGAYGKPAPNSMGAPLRLHTPWKYGFKSIKGILKVSFITERVKGMWEQISPQEYGFWANVNPEVPHPRWSQAEETVLGTGEMIPTRIYNGYGGFVASLYDGLKGEHLFM
jgi:sulfoxide reductase catalytic subunit YedY